MQIPGLLPRRPGFGVQNLGFGGWGCVMAEKSAFLTIPGEFFGLKFENHQQSVEEL